VADGIPDDLYIGQELLGTGVVDRDELVDCIIEASRERKGGQFGRPLGVVLVDRGLISEGQLASILGKRVNPAGGDVSMISEIALGKLFVASGYATPAQVDDCLGEQKREREAGEPVKRLGELLVERGYSTSQQVMRVLAYQQKRIYECPSCSARYNVASPKAGTVYRCKKCQQELKPVSRGATDAPTQTEDRARATDRSEAEQIELDRAILLYARQKQLARRDILREAEQLQMDIRRYGLVVPVLNILRRLGGISWQQQQEIEKINFAEVIHKPGWGDQAVPGYKLISKIAAGGYATLYTAEPVFGGPKVALKLLHPDRSKQDRAVKRFQREAALLRKFSHENIVRGIDSGEANENHYLVMEYVDGRSLGQRIAEGGAMGVREATAVVRQVADALRYLHTEGYLHRDVKPDNILVTGTGRAVLADLGFAAVIGEAGTARVGTEGYISPEQAAGSEVKVGTDIYALGITYYAMLTGFEPFGATQSEETVASQVEEGMPTPNLMVVQAPAPVVALLRKMMHHDRAKRFKSVQELLAALENVK
jgi:ribosomal protein L37AE/L43A/predicted Ser/Thr protein kinase